MPKTNINKFAAFVILASACGIAAAGCGLPSPRGSAVDISGSDAPYEKPIVSGKLESPDLKEASGIAASKCQPDVFWTHNDSGDGALLYAIDSKGKHLGVWRVAGAFNRDWEDIAAVKDGERCYILIGEIGDNERKYARLGVYRIEEPTIAGEAGRSSAKEPMQTAEAKVTYLKYPNERHDAEALLVHPSNGEMYILTKSNGGPSHVYKFRPTFTGEDLPMAKVAELTVPAVPNGSITGGDISADGRRIALCDYFSGYELTLPDASQNFDEIWKQKPLRIELGKREQGEAIAYSADGSFVIAVSEKRHTSVNVARRKATN